MADMGNYSYAHGLGIQCFGRGGAPNPSTIFETGVLSDYLFSSTGSAREERAHLGRKLLHIVAVFFFSTDSLPFAPSCPGITVAETFFFRLFQSRRFD